MEAQVSEILENILSLLSLEGSFEVTEQDEGIFVTIDTDDAGRLIGHQGETLSSLQLLVNQIFAKQSEEYKRVIVDVSNWRKSKEEDLAERAKGWAEEVKESGEEMKLEPMPSWQRRIVHLTIEEADGVESESMGEGPDRHLVIKPTGKKSPKSKKSESKDSESKGSEDESAES